jgi:hypothetical protein
MDTKDQYLIGEMQACRGRIDQEIAAMNKFETVSVIAIGAIYWLFFSERIQDQAAIVLLTALPVIICAYGLFRYRAHASIVQVHEAYVKSVEAKVLKEPGFVTHYDSNKSSLLKYARVVFWSVMLAMSFALLVVAVVCPEKISRVHNRPGGSKSVTFNEDIFKSHNGRTVVRPSQALGSASGPRA